IGFELLEDLRGYLNRSQREAWSPATMCRNWPQRARQIFSGHAQDAKPRAAMLVVGVVPRKRVLRGAVPVMCCFRSPDFIPDVVGDTCEVMSIGTGTENTAAMESLRRVVVNVDLMTAERVIGTFGRTIALDMTRELFFGAPAGVSKHMHVTIVGRNVLSTTAN